MDVFMSHSSADAARTERIAQSLHGLGVSTWMASRDIQVGDNYAAEIWGAIEGSSALAIVMTRRALSSEHVKREVNVAVTLNRPLLPVSLGSDAVMDGDLSGDWRYWLGVVQIAHVRDEPEAARLIAQRLGFAGDVTPPDPQASSPQEGKRSVEAPAFSARMESQIRSALIKTAAAGGTFQMASERARRLGASGHDVQVIAERLREAKLLDFEGDPHPDTRIRLT